MPLTLGAKTFFVPGAYAIIKVINAGGNAVPVFNVGAIIAKQMGGVPYTVGVGTSPDLSAGIFIKGFSDIAEFMNVCGNDGDNEGATAFRYAKKAGAGTVYFIGVNPTTPMEGGTIVNQEGAPELALTIDTKLKQYGAQVNDISLTIADSIHTIIPVKKVTFLTQDSGTGKTISVNNTLGYKQGDIVYLVSNTIAAQQKVVDSIDVDARTISFTVDIATEVEVDNYARIYQPDTNNQEVSTQALDTADKVKAFYANSAYLNVSVSSGVSAMPTTLAKTIIGGLTSATMATSPAADATDWQNIADNFRRWNEEFALVNKVYMRLLNIVTSDTDNHVAFATLATNMRSLNKPIQIVTGCELGDYLNIDDTEPKARALALNSDEIQLAGFGLEGYGSYISFAPYLFGVRLANAVNHNQTLDLLQNVTSVEKSFDRDDPDLEAYIKNGVVAVMATKTGFKISQGINTYQNQSVSFDPDTAKSYLVMLRDLADFDLRMQLEVLDSLAGADGVTREVVSAAVVQASDLEKDVLKYISSYRILQLSKAGNAWKVYRKIGLDSPTDFIGLINYILVDSAEQPAPPAGSLQA
jgi:hypothetical protein